MDDGFLKLCLSILFYWKFKQKKIYGLNIDEFLWDTNTYEKYIQTKKLTTSTHVWLPAEFKHINERRKRN